MVLRVRRYGQWIDAIIPRDGLDQLLACPWRGTFALGGGDDYTLYLEAGSMADFAKLLGIEHYPGVLKFLEGDYRKATQSISFGGSSATAVELPVVR